ncbi:MAG TPA: CapA family protein [Acidimicrobiia bacterium]
MVRGAVVVLAVVLVAACGGDDRATFDTRTTLTALAQPATTTTDRATTTISAAPRRGRLVVSATGDVNLDPGYIPELAAEGYSYPWSGLQDMFHQDDLTVVNLECAASDLGEPEAKAFVFRCDPDALDEMAAAGVEVANLGNNHSGDYGKEALVDSVRQVEAGGMAAVGAGVDSEQAHRAAVFAIDGWTVAVVGFGGVYPTLDWFATEDRPGMADGDTVETMVATGPGRRCRG